MIAVETTAIYVAKDGYVDFRDGEIELDSDERSMLRSIDDLNGALHVRGLQPADIAVMLHFTSVEYLPPRRRITPHDVGYFVTSVDEIGDGILVPGNAMDANPRMWRSPRLTQIVHSLQPGEFDQFTVPSLAEFIKNN